MYLLIQNFFVVDELQKRIMNVTANKKLFSTFKTYFQSYNLSFKSLKNMHQFPQNPGNHNQNGYKIELVNTRNNIAAITATNIPYKRNIKIGRSS